MNKRLASNKYLTPYGEVLRDHLKDPEFRQVWEAGAARREAVKAIIGERLRHKMTQEQLAQKAGLKQPNVARIESGNVAPTIDMLGKIAQAFGKGLQIRFT